jgi:hypothetical protein
MRDELAVAPCDGIIGTITIRKNVVNHDKNIIILTIEANRLPPCSLGTDTSTEEKAINVH